MEMADGLLATLISAFDSDKVISRLREPMLGHRVAVFGVHLDIAVRFNHDFLSPITKVPYLVAEGGSERAHFEGDRVAGVDAHRWRKGWMDRRRELIRR